MERINVGCGMTPTPGWRNVDNSLSLRLARFPVLAGILRALGIVNREQKSYIDFCTRAGIAFADATRRLPLVDASADVVYSSHMLEHLTRDQAARFLAEARRVLAPGGILRLAHAYIESGDADRFAGDTLLAEATSETWRDRLRAVLTGPRHHLWMYDGVSLSKLVAAAGFEDAVVLEPGATTIPDPGPLDLAERAGESVYVEARRIA